MTIYYSSPDGYARRPRAPRRRREPVARRSPAQLFGQTTLAQLARDVHQAYAMNRRCPACRARVGEPCTRKPIIGETGRQDLGWTCHPQRVAEADPQ